MVWYFKWKRQTSHVVFLLVISSILISLVYVRFWLYQAEKENEKTGGNSSNQGPHKNMMAWLWVWGDQPKLEDEMYYVGKRLSDFNWDLPHENRVPEQYSQL